MLKYLGVEAPAAQFSLIHNLHFGKMFLWSSFIFSFMWFKWSEFDSSYTWRKHCWGHTTCTPVNSVCVCVCVCVCVRVCASESERDTHREMEEVRRSVNPGCNIVNICWRDAGKRANLCEIMLQTQTHTHTHPQIRGFLSNLSSLQFIFSVFGDSTGADSAADDN